MSEDRFKSFAVKLEQARKNLPLERLMMNYGFAPDLPKRKFKHCPFCKKDGAEISGRSGRDFFKCYHTSCPSGKAREEIGFLSVHLGLNWREASITYLKEAGVWEEAERHAPSVIPGKAPRRIQPPEIPPEDLADGQPNEAVEPTAEEIVAAFGGPDAISAPAVQGADVVVLSAAVADAAQTVLADSQKEPSQGDGELGVNAPVAPAIPGLAATTGPGTEGEKAESEKSRAEKPKLPRLPANVIKREGECPDCALGRPAYALDADGRLADAANNTGLWGAHQINLGGHDCWIECPQLTAEIRRPEPAPVPEDRKFEGKDGGMKWKRRLKMDPLGVTDVTGRGLRRQHLQRTLKDVCHYGRVERDSAAGTG